MLSDTVKQVKHYAVIIFAYINLVDVLLGINLVKNSVTLKKSWFSGHMYCDVTGVYHKVFQDGA